MKIQNTNPAGTASSYLPPTAANASPLGQGPAEGLSPLTGFKASVAPPSPFASMLQQQASWAATAASAHAPAPSAPAASKPANDGSTGPNGSNESNQADDGAPPADAASSTEADALAAARARNAAKTRSGRDGSAPAAPDKAGREEARDVDASRDSRAAERKAAAQAADGSVRHDDSTADTPATDAGTLPAWMLGLMPQNGTAPATPGGLPGAGADPAGAADTAAAAGNTLGETAGSAPRGRAGGARRGEPGIASTDHDSAAGLGRDAAGRGDASVAGAAGSFAAALAAQPQAAAALAEANPRSSERGGFESVGGAHGAHSIAAPDVASTSASGSDAASTTRATVQAEVGSPEFPQELGVQLSVLAKDGVQKAELHLNPTEMGPVSVQIVMDGTQARVDFGADVAATRQAIEAGLPELASALRDAGFTLAGGGVSSQAGGRQSSPDGDGETSGRGGSRRLGSVDGTADTSGAARTLRTRVKAGGIDLYA